MIAVGVLFLFAFSIADIEIFPTGYAVVGPNANIINAVTSSTLSLKWNAVTGATGYNIYIASEPELLEDANKRKLVASLSSSTTSYTIKDLAPEVDTFVRVEALGGSVASDDKFMDDYAKTIGGPRAKLDNLIREVHLSAPNILMVIAVDEKVDYNGGNIRGYDGPAWQSGTWTVKRKDGSSISVNNVYRHSIAVGQPDFTFDNSGDKEIIDVDHIMYLVLDQNIGNNEILEVTGPFNTKFTLLFSDKYLVSPTIKVNQVGYNPWATRRYAYISEWIGADKNGVGQTLSLNNFPASANVLIQPKDEFTTRNNFALQNLQITLRSSNDWEAATEVKEIDIASLPVAEGVTYRVHIPGVGVSWPTAVSKLAAFKAFYTVQRGGFQQRWFGDLSSQYTDWYRPNGGGPPSGEHGKKDHGYVYKIGFSSNPSQKPSASECPVFGNGTPNGPRLFVDGAHKDAGDHDIRPWHISSAQLWMRTYEMNPNAFTDGQLTIPESGNGIPDILDEVLWQLKGWQAVQENDGGIPLGWEAPQHPPYGYANTDPLNYCTYSVEDWQTAYRAALFAQAAYLVKPFDAAKSAELKDAAIRAYDYAQSKNAKDAFLAYAASELWRLTGETKYKTYYESVARGDSSYFSSMKYFFTIGNSYFFKYQPGGDSDPDSMPDHMVAYLKTPGYDPSLKDKYLKKVKPDIKEVRDRVIGPGVYHAYRNPRKDGKDLSIRLGRDFDGAYQIRDLGEFTSQEAQDDFDARSLAADYILGANPDGWVVITGLGSRYPVEPLHMDSLAFIGDNRVGRENVPKTAIPGIPVYAYRENKRTASYYQRVYSVFYPDISAIPPMERKVDTRTAVDYNEFSFASIQAPHMQLFAGLMKEPISPPDCWLPGRSEHRSTLPIDCGNIEPPVCGNQICEVSKGETCSSCSQDCGTCPPETHKECDLIAQKCVVVSGPGPDQCQFDYQCVPPPPNGDSTQPNLKVAFIGDAGVNSNDPAIRAREVLELIKNEGVDLVIHSGDLGYGNEDAQSAIDFENQLNSVLGQNFPYFYSVGNHDAPSSAWIKYQEFLQNRINRLEAIDPNSIECSGDLGVKSSCKYKGLFFILSGIGTKPNEINNPDHTNYIKQQLSNDNSVWSVCNWHKNQKEMQVGGKISEVGWDAYEICREEGAIISTSHEHSYQRTKTLISMIDQTVDPNNPLPNILKVAPGKTFAFVSGLGGKSIRSQSRCSPSNYPYGCKGEWANIYTSTQGAKFGVLFIEFNVDGDPNKARGYFKNIDGLEIDSFIVLADSSSTPPPQADVCGDNKCTGSETCASCSFDCGVCPVGNKVVPLADAYVNKDNPNANFGKDVTLQVDGSPIKLTYIKFDLSGFADKQITNAKLRFYVTGSSGSKQYVKKEDSTSWVETDITYGNKPVLGPVIATMNGGVKDNWIEVDVTSYVNERNGKIISMGIDPLDANGKSGGSDGLYMNSREASSGKPTPELVLEISEDPPQKVECNDGIDNDGDGKIDLNDSECLDSSDNSEAPRDFCSDSDGGINGDSKGTITGEDSNAPFSNSDFCVDTNTLKEYYCGNKIQGYDPLSQNIVCINGCSNGACLASPPPKECSDGIDNDGDGKIDLDDAGCVDSNDNDETNCGDNVCEGGETSQSCPADCGSPPPTTKKALSYKTTQAPVIDGINNEWSNIQGIKVSASDLVKGLVDNDADASAIVKSMWDNNKLYFLVEVTDGNLVDDSINPWHDDGSEIYLDGGNEKASNYDWNDYQLIVDIGNSIGGTRSDQLLFEHAVNIPTTPNSYKIEYAVPWPALSGSPFIGRLLGFDVAINDDDDGGDRDGQLIWNDKTGEGWRNPSVFGTIELVDGGTPPQADVCGDNKCTGSETCASCSFDCGVCPPPTTGDLLVHFKFDEGSGLIAKDSSGNNNDGVLKNGPKWKTGAKVGPYALDFDGRNDYVDFGKMNIPRDKMTIAAWVKPDNIGRNCYQDGCRVVVKSNGLDLINTIWMLSVDPTGKRGDITAGIKMRLKTNGITTELVSTRDVLQDGHWTHVAAVYDGNNMILYADGDEVGRVSKSGGITQSADGSWVGAGPPGVNDEFPGLIDDVRIYNKALSQTEIMDLMKVQ